MDALQVPPPVCVPDVKDGKRGRYFILCKKIWDSIDQDELHEIKQYLQIIEDPKFSRGPLGKVTKCVELIRLLEDRDLLGINKLSFIKTLLKHMNRDDLLREVNNYEEESVKATDAKPRRPKSDPTYASSDIRCEIRHLQQSIDTKKLEIEHEIQYQSNLSTELEKLKDDMEEQTEIISNNEMKLATIDLGKKQKQENERKYRDEAEEIEAKISQLQKEMREKLYLARSLLDDIDRMSQEHRDVQYLISQSKDKKNEISKQYKDKSGKKSECSQTIKNFQLEIHKLELQINRRSENLKYQPLYRPNSNKKGSDLNSGAFSDVTTDAIPTERANTINKENWIGENEITPEKKNTNLKDIDILHFSQAIKPSSLLQVATFLGIPRNEVDSIKCNNPHSADSWTNELLLKWRDKKGREATAGNLLEKLSDAWNLDSGYIDPQFVRKALDKL